MPDVLCLGEILVDWVCTTVGAELPEAVEFTKAPGGAPANTAVGLARQGISTGFIGRVSKDEFGRWLKSVLEKNDIDVSATIEDPNAQTRMAYVVTTSTGDRKLADFTRIACADARLEESDLKEEQFKQASIIHFGSISLIEEPAKSATNKAIQLAKQNHCLISYDPNVRLSLWPTDEACKDTILNSLPLADIVKINEVELEFLTGKKGLEAANQLRKEKNIPLLIITLDSRGAYFVTENFSETVPGFDIKLVEATGAGDGFNAGVLSGFLSHIKNESNKREKLKNLSTGDIQAIIRTANGVGALTCTKAGAIPALPAKDELARFLNSRKAPAK